MQSADNQPLQKIGHDIHSNAVSFSSSSDQTNSAPCHQKQSGWIHEHYTLESAIFNSIFFTMNTYFLETLFENIGLTTSFHKFALISPNKIFKWILRTYQIQLAFLIVTGHFIITIFLKWTMHIYNKNITPATSYYYIRNPTTYELFFFLLPDMSPRCTMTPVAI